MLFFMKKRPRKPYMTTLTDAAGTTFVSFANIFILHRAILVASVKSLLQKSFLLKKRKIFILSRPLSRISI